MISATDRIPDFLKSLEKATEKARYLVSEQVLADCNRHARRDTGELIRSSRMYSDTRAGVLVWDTPYAKRVYFEGVPNTTTNHNPEAVLMWCDYAYDRYHEDWQGIVAGVLKEVE